MSCCEPRLPAASPTLQPGSHPPARIERAAAADRPAIEALLGGAGLPTAGLDDALLFVAREPGSGRLGGVAGLEVWGRAALLRSLVVAPARRGLGLGKALAARIEQQARDLGLAELHLLTTGAAPFFRALGYEEAARAQAPAALSGSAEWKDAVCPGSATLLRKPLEGDDDAVREAVRARYGAIAREGSSCGSICGSDSTAIGYDAALLGQVPAGADLGLGCGAPLQEGRPAAGETVLDLGSGGGLDAFLAAREVGPAGRVIGVDMTPDMIARARGAAERAGFANVEFREGFIEKLPVEDRSVDLIISNCVINLSPDKDAVFREAFRVLRPGGRLAVSDMVTDREIPARLRADMDSVTACVGGAIPRSAYLDKLRGAGFASVEVPRDVAVAELDGAGLRSITVVARKS